MAISLNQLSNVTTAALALSNLVLVSPQSTKGYQPQIARKSSDSKNPISTEAPPAPLVFQYEGEQAIRLSTDITDHYVEDNTAVQDQIALHPEEYTTHGFIGELNDILPEELQILKTAADKLTTIGAYTPRLTEAAQIAYAEALLAYQTAQTVKNAAVSAWSSVSNLFNGGGDGQAVIGDTIVAATSPQNKQQQMFQMLYGYYAKKTLFTIQTPWAVFQNMAIKDINVVQDDTTRVITDFEITFKRIRFAKSITTGLASAVSGRLGAQSDAKTNLGASAPTPSAVPSTAGPASAVGF